MEGDFFVGTSLAVALVKLVLRFSKLAVPTTDKNRLHSEVCAGQQRATDTSGGRG